MLGGSQIVPFHRPPKKEWKTGAEKKKRLYIDLSKEEDGLEEEVPTFYEDDSESSEESEESFDMQEYIAGLLPGEVVDGKKPLKKANTSHLEDLRVKKQKRDRWYFKMLFRFIIRKRREERERRKHYILKEWEKKLKEYVEKQQQAVQAKMEQHRKEVLLEQHRSNMRRIRNSRKKVEKSAHIELFTADLKRRDLEAKKLHNYCENLSTWAIEGYERKDREVVEVQRIADEAVLIAKEKAKVARKQKLIEEDAAILEADKRMTAEIETMMVQYGMLEFEPDLNETDDQKLDAIFSRNRSMKAIANNNNNEEGDENNAALTIGDNASAMKINLKKDIDLIYLRKKLRKSAHRRTSTLPSPFQQDLSGTGQIITLTGIKVANLLSLRELKLKGNFIRAEGLMYMLEICPSGVFMNLANVDLSENELGDEGVGVLVNIVLQGHFMNLVELNLQLNSITDQGFNKIVSVMKSLKDTKCPFLERLKIGNNLVSAQARRRNAPYPPFFSF
eukprot:gene7540-9037_t